MLQGFITTVQLFKDIYYCSLTYLHIFITFITRN